MKYLLIPLFLIVFTTTAFAASLDAVISPTTAAPGSNLKLTIKTIDVPNSKWFVAFDVTLSGCIRKENSQTTINDFMLDEVNADQTKEYNLQASSTEGVCTLDIKYQFTGDAEETIKITAEIKAHEAEVTPPTPEITPPAELEPTNYAGWITTAAIVVIGIILFLLVTKKKKEPKKTRTEKVYNERAAKEFELAARNFEDAAKELTAAKEHHNRGEHDKAVEHHKTAAKHHRNAAEHHKTAAKHLGNISSEDAKNHLKAAQLHLAAAICHEEAAEESKGGKKPINIDKLNNLFNKIQGITKDMK